MRVIGGEWRGRRLRAPAGRDTRPTSDRVREAVFDVLCSLSLAGRLPATRAPALAAGVGTAGPLAGCTAIDVFAGSGALGIEALSRGASSCVFVESGAAALRVLRGNLRALDVSSRRVRVLSRDARSALEKEVAHGERYTLLFADPPYAGFEQHGALLARVVPALLQAGGVAVIETCRTEEPRVPLATVLSRTYGDTRVTVLCNEGRPGAADRKATRACPTE